RTTTVAQQLSQRPSPSQLDKENVTPKPAKERVEEESAVDNANDIMKRLSRVQHMFLPKEPKQSADNGGSWSMLLAKANHNPELRQDLAQLTMKYANDESLVRLDRRAQTDPKARQTRRPSPPTSPPYRTTRRTMTLQEEVTCIDSPPKYSAAYSHDTRQ
uniref:Uncharacterized protein n=1 Tax=Plectus sambesii TaxID=2011161 RepID=A0A914VDG7_9BILA